MAKVDIDKMCDACIQILGAKYVSPGSTSKDVQVIKKSGIDCSGMFVRAYKMQGFTIPHGSNAIWRLHMDDSCKGKLTSVDELRRGMAVFKWKETGTPDKYASDGLGNFSHIGLVLSTNPLRIIHASSAAGIVTTDNSIKLWSYYGKLKAVDYDAVDCSIEDGPVEPVEPVEPEKPAEQEKIMYVYASNGLPVNMRKWSDKKADLVDRVPNGEAVIVKADGPEWCKIAWKKKEGYMMKIFLTEEKKFYSEEDVRDYKKMYVTAEHGDTVNMRTDNMIGSALIERVPVGSAVSVLKKGDEWTRISYKGNVGYMMSKFLSRER